MQIVTAYLNERARKPVTAHDSATTARPDIQMGVYVLSRLLDGEQKLGGLVHLKEIDLRHIQVDEAQLINTKFLGVDFGRATLSRADFSGSDLTASEFKEADLPNADFTGTTLDFVNFEGADLSAANFCGVRSRRDIRLENVRADAGARCLHP